MNMVIAAVVGNVAATRILIGMVVETFMEMTVIVATRGTTINATVTAMDA